MRSSYVSFKICSGVEYSYAPHAFIDTLSLKHFPYSYALCSVAHVHGTTRSHGRGIHVQFSLRSVFAIKCAIINVITNDLLNDFWLIFAKFVFLYVIYKLDWWEELGWVMVNNESNAFDVLRNVNNKVNQPWRKKEEKTTLGLYIHLILFKQTIDWSRFSSQCTTCTWSIVE